MFSAIHVKMESEEPIQEGLINIAAKRGLQPQANGSCQWEVLTFANGVGSDSWISIVENNNLPLKSFAINVSVELPSPVIGIYIRNPDEWGFWACKDGRVVSAYSWDMETKDLEDKESIIRDLEIDRLRELGVDLPKNTNEFMREKLLRRARHISSSDPVLEMKFRSRVSGDLLVPQSPCMDPDLPKRLVGLFPGKSKARFKKILGCPHLEINHMAVAFANYLALADVFVEHNSISLKRDMLANNKNFSVLRFR